MKKMIMFVASFLFITGYVSVASAATLWSSVAADCTLDSSSTASPVFNNNDGSVSFASGSTGLIRLTCRVTPFSIAGCPTNSALYQTSADGDGGGGWDNYYVTVWFNKIPKGTSSTVTNIANVESSTTTKNEVTESSGSFFTSAINFSSNYHWISIDLYRAGTTHSPKFWGVTIYC